MCVHRRPRRRPASPPTASAPSENSGAAQGTRHAPSTQQTPAPEHRQPRRAECPACSHTAVTVRPPSLEAQAAASLWQGLQFLSCFPLSFALSLPCHRKENNVLSPTQVAASPGLAPMPKDRHRPPGELSPPRVLKPSSPPAPPHPHQDLQDNHQSGHTAERPPQGSWHMMGTRARHRLSREPSAPCLDQGRFSHGALDSGKRAPAPAHRGVPGSARVPWGGLLAG